MIKVAICDDMEVDRRILREYIIAFYGDVQVDEYPNGERLLRGLQRERYQLILLDIEMEEKTGIEVKNILEQQGNDSYIIFVTGYRQFILSTFGKNVIGFIDKPIEQQKLFDILERIDHFQPRYRMLEIEKIDGRMVKVNEEQILYIKSEHVYSRVVMASGEEHIVRKSLNQWHELLEPLFFARAQKSYIVHWRFVENVDSFVQFESGMSVKVSRGKVKELKEKYREYIRKTARLI